LIRDQDVAAIVEAALVGRGGSEAARPIRSVLASTATNSDRVAVPK